MIKVVLRGILLYNNYTRSKLRGITQLSVKYNYKFTYRIDKTY